MTNELIHLPEVTEVKDLLTAAKHDISAIVEEDAEMATHTKLALEVIGVIDEQLAKGGDLNTLTLKEKISFAAHLNFLQCLLEDIFFDEDEFEDEEFEEIEESSEEE